MKTAKSFYEKYNGGGWDYDNGYGLQCVDGARIWMDYFLGESRPTPNGYAGGYRQCQQWFRNLGCTVITNYKNLKDGDLVIFPVSKYYPSTHVGMYYKGKLFGMNQKSVRADRKFCLLSNPHFEVMSVAYRSSNCKQESSSSGSTSGGKYALVSEPQYKQSGYANGKKKIIAVNELNVRQKNSTTSKSLCTLNENDYIMYFGWYAGDHDGSGKYWLWCNAYKYNKKTKEYTKYTGFVRNDTSFYK